jgi:hypothetical protein
VETKAHLWFFLNKVGGRCGCVYGTKGAVDRKSMGTAALIGLLLLLQSVRHVTIILEGSSGKELCTSSL